MKSAKVRAGPSKAEILAAVDCMLSDISDARHCCKSQSRNGLVQLSHAHDCAVRLRQLIVELPENSGKFKRVVKAIAEVAKWCAELYSLLSFKLIALYLCTLEKLFNYSVFPKGCPRRTCQLISELLEPISPKSSLVNEYPG